MSFLGKLKSSKSARFAERNQKSKDFFKTSPGGSKSLFLDVNSTRSLQDSEPHALLGAENSTPPNITVQNPSPEPDRFTKPPLLQLEKAVKDTRIPLSQSLDSIPTLGSSKKYSDCEWPQEESE